MCAVALIRSTGCTGIFGSSSVSLRILVAPAHFLDISPSKWHPPYLSLDIIHVGQSFVPGIQPRLREMCIFFSRAATQSLPKTMSSVFRCCAFVAPVRMMSSKYTTTRGMPCKVVSMVLWNIASAELMPCSSNMLHRNNPFCVGLW